MRCQFFFLQVIGFPIYYKVEYYFYEKYWGTLAASFRRIPKKYWCILNLLLLFIYSALNIHRKTPRVNILLFSRIEFPLFFSSIIFETLRPLILQMCRIEFLIN